ncbi:MAG: flagellar basal body-associated FliL family protein [Chthonomonadaceae bacterium]|nr:flagellar basal body-associated FliL family protein [Chthonomonadaceae bacterium]
MSADDKKEGGEKKKKGLPMPVLMIVVLIVGLFVGKIFLGGSKAEAKEKGKKESKSKDKKEHKEVEGHYLPLEDFTVNLSGKGDHYLKASVSIKVPKTITEEKFKEFAAPMRDAVVMTLSAKELKDLITPEGKEKLKEQLKEKLSAAAKEEDLVEEVCFTQFATQ